MPLNNPLPILATLAALLLPSPNLLAQPAFIEAGGVIAMEAEAMGFDPAFWRLDTQLSGYSGDGYIVGKVDSFGKGGKGVIRFPIKISTAGRYQLSWKSRITEGNTSTDFNDSFARVLDTSETFLEPVPNQNVKIGPDWYKVYMNKAGDWSWDAANKDNDAHSLSWNLESGKTYFFEISARSKGHGIDRIFLWNTGLHSFANKNTGKGANGNSLDALPSSLREVADADADADGLPDSWESKYGTSSTSIDPASDFDRDTLSAALEFAIGSDPNAFTPPPATRVANQNGQAYHDFEYTRSTQAAQFFDLVVQHSDDLVTWSQYGLAPVSETAIDPDTTRLTSRLPAAPIRYFRLKANKR